MVATHHSARRHRVGSRGSCPSCSTIPNVVDSTSSSRRGDVTVLSGANLPGLRKNKHFSARSQAGWTRRRRAPACRMVRGMRVGITGASGLIGTALTRHLEASGHEVRPFVRRPAGAERDQLGPRSRHPRSRRPRRSRRRGASRRSRHRRPSLDRRVQGVGARQPRARHDAARQGDRRQRRAPSAAERLGDRDLRQLATPWSTSAVRSATTSPPGSASPGRRRRLPPRTPECASPISAPGSCSADREAR